MASPDGLPPGPRFSRRARLAWIAVWIAIAAALAWAGSHVAWREVWAAMRQANLAWVAAAVAMNLCGLPLWALAFRQFIPPGEPSSFPRVLETLVITHAAIQSFSIFAGGAIAAWLLLKRVGLSTGAMIGVIALEQLATGVAKSMIVAAAVLLTAAPLSLKAAGGLLLAAATIGVAILLWAAHSGDKVRRVAERLRGWPARWVLAFADWTSHLDTMRRPGRFAVGVAFTLGRRVMETMGILCVQAAVGIPLSAEMALLVIAALALATIVPAPGNLGMYEAAVVFAYTWNGVPAEIAVAAALLQHVAWLAAAFIPGYGLLAFWKLRGRPLALR